MAGCELGGAAVSELGGWGQHSGMVDQRVAEPDPQLRVAGMLAHGRAQDARRVGGVAPARHRFDISSQCSEAEKSPKKAWRAAVNGMTSFDAAPVGRDPARPGLPCKA